MITKADIDRLDLSEQVIEGWERMDGPMGTPSELLRLLEAELRVLATRRPEDPDRVDALTTRYTRLAKKLRLQIL